MRHGKKFNHLGRQTAHRKAMLANMACSLIAHKRINTTLAKAKALRVYVEPLITKSKNDNTHNRRVVFSYLKDKNAITELFREVATKVADRPGGYLRIIKLGNRQGDNADMAMVELVDYNELYNPNGKKKKKSTRRGKAKKEATPVVEETKEEVKAETKEAPKAVEEKPAENDSPKEEK
ncbi:MAG: 50S ribosomal protein L17 [Flavobacteriaceae bacterium]